jgi:hypothetical protein
MKATDFARKLKEDIEQAKAQGVEKIRSENLISYLSEMEKNLESQSEADIEIHRANLQKWIEDHKNAHAHSVEMFRSVIAAGQNALRTSFLMNGGASVAILAFIGHLAATSSDNITLFSSVLSIFVIGVLVSAVASGTTYLSQWFYASGDKYHKTGFGLNIVAIILGLGSYGVFAWGIYEAQNAFTNFT